MPRKIPPELWAGAKADFELGKLTDAEIAKKYKINHSTLTKKIAVNGWVRGRLVPRLQETIAEKNLQLFAKHGVTPDRIAQVMSETIDGLPARLTDIRAQIDDLVSVVQSTGKPDLVSIPKLINSIQRYGNFKNTILQYIQEVNKMIGGHAPLRREITGKDGGPISVVATMKHMSDEELETTIKQYLKRYAKIK